eukprot:CAMPEP_0197597352 /NCGR_PEP_ID=MMETSP1326-20131121/27151_1 /TAXON_ID=1155430 /ORGANISM="Genus nov. species nov., Strain RCC2288" /LENGTH=33 /DNA_ID= /DNA_START= /DNA_END= /DNA_ORIENTATION=
MNSTAKNTPHTGSPEYTMDATEGDSDCSATSSM